MVPKPFASFWLAAGDSGFASSPDWQGWADRRVESDASPPIWVIDLSTTPHKDGLWRVLLPAIDAEEEAGFPRKLIYEAVLGYLWLRYERGDIGLKMCLKLAAQHADAYDTSIECELFYSLLNRLEDVSTNTSIVERKAKTLFEPFTELARMQWAVLQSTF